MGNFWDSRSIFDGAFLYLPLHRILTLVSNRVKFAIAIKKGLQQNSNQYASKYILL